jgi:Cu/Ag efflux protein CusF
MKNINIIMAVLSLGLLLGSPVNTRAADAPNDTPAGKTEKKAKHRPFNGTVKAVNLEAKTITLQGDKAQQFAIGAETVIKKEGQPATLASIAAGDKIGGRARETADGKWEAVTINLGTKAVKETPQKKTE